MPHTTRRYVVEIDSQEGRYQGRVHSGDASQARVLPDLQLGPQATVTIKGTAYPLGTLVQALISHRPEDIQQAYDERGQWEIGRYLYQQIFGTMARAERQQLRDATVDVRLVTADEHIARLPWTLLADEGVFLCTTGWSVALARALQPTVCQLPRSPRLLILAPQPVGVPDTQANIHLEALETILAAVNPRHVREQDLRVVATWEAFAREVTAFQPHLVYYYGHGIGDANTSRLVFASEPNNRRTDKPIGDLALCLRSLPEGLPLLAYLNCCFGDAGGLLGVGQLLGATIPAVLTNSTVASIDAAHAQGLAFWRSVLLDGLPPHRAVADMRRNLVSMGLSLSDPRWMTPVLHAHYATWEANPPQAQSRLEHDPHWRLKLDRVPQFGQVFYQTTQMLQERRPRTLAYVWYGQPGQGVELFHQRLAVELQEKLPQLCLYEINPRWPEALDRPDLAFEDMLTEAFDVHTLEAIPGRIRAYNRGVAGRQTLVYVRHLPVQSSKLITPAVLKTYLEWWDTCMTRLLDGQVFALLGVSFVVGKPETFQRVVEERVRLPATPLTSTVLQLLAEMGRVSKQDLLDFLHTHNLTLPLTRRERLLDDILARTKGDYDLTLEALKDSVARAWAASEPEPTVSPGTADDYDYN